MSHSQSKDVDIIRISSIAVNVLPQSDNIVNRVSLYTKTADVAKVTEEVKISPGHQRKKVFDNPLVIYAGDKPNISLECRPLQSEAPVRSISLDLSNIMAEAEDGEKKYSLSHEDIEVVVGVSSHAPPREAPQLLELSYEVATPSSDTLSICPRLRLLVIGNSGAGKSSLIKKLFGITNVDISDRRRGDADINTELEAPNNLPFVLHDSLGFEAADQVNLNLVKDFITDRQNRTDIKERLHAVWVCLAVPYAKGRFTEYSTEEFLQDRKKILGDVPLIVALTQLDLLDKMLIMKVRTEGNLVKSISEASPFVVPRRKAFLDEFCSQPLRKVAGDDIPHVAVSTEAHFGLEPFLTEIMKTTVKLAENYIRTERRWKGKQRAM